MTDAYSSTQGSAPRKSRRAMRRAARSAATPPELRGVVEWAKQELDVTLWSRQAEIAEAVLRHPRVAVRSANAVGKSFLAACLAIWYLQTHRPGYVVTTSSSWRGVVRVLWPEIRRLVRGARTRLEGTLLNTEWRRGDQWGAFGVSAVVPENFAGFRTPNGVFVIVDEASAIEREIFDAIMGLVASGDSRVLMIGNPLRPHGPFHDVFRLPTWRSLHISALESPNVAAGREVVPGLATRDWVEERRREWGEESPSWLARVLGEFPEEGENVLIPLAWVEAALRRAAPAMHRESLRLGCDVARFGSDLSAFIVRDRHAVRHSETHARQSTMTTAGRVLALAREWGVPPERVAIDDTGVGGGVTDRLREQRFPVAAVNFGAAALDPERFANARAEMYWSLRDALCPEGGLSTLLAIPPALEDLAREIAQPLYSYTSKGQIRIESKDTLRARLGRSPDRADALAITFAPVGALPRVYWL